MRHEVTEVVHASPEAVYDLVADIERMGDWSPSCVACEWVGERRAVPGARFVGTNRRGPVKWKTLNEVVAADRGQCFSWVMGVDHDGGSTVWTYRFEPTADGTAVTEAFELTPAQRARGRALSGRIWEALGRLVGLSDENTVRGMRETLGRIKRAAEADHVG